MTLLLLMIACGNTAPSSSASSVPSSAASSAPPAVNPAAAAPAEIAAPAPAAPEPQFASKLGYGLLGVDYACASCSSVIGAPNVTAEASSELAGGAYGAANVLSEDWSRAWCEGQPDAGVGASVTVRLGTPAELEAVGLWGGFFKSEPLLRANGRVMRARLTTDSGTDEVITLEDPVVAKAVDASTRGQIDDWFSHMRASSPPWHTVTTGRGKPSAWFKVEILEVYPGEKYTDTCITVLDALLVEPD